MGVWDDPDLMAGGDFFTFHNDGDTISGTINAIRVHRFEDGKAAPQLLLTTDQGLEQTVSGGAVQLKIELGRLRPNVGDHITITQTSSEKRAGGKTLKHWAVEVRAGNGQPPQAQPQQYSPVNGGFQPPTQYAPAQQPQAVQYQQPVYQPPAGPGPYQQPQQAPAPQTYPPQGQPGGPPF